MRAGSRRMEMFTSRQISSWDRIYRANFVNSLTGFKSASLVGTIDDAGRTNLAIISSVIHIGSNPSLVGYINRPIASAPHTLANIRSTGEYSINHIDASFLPAAHQTSARYPPDISEFEAVHLEPEFVEGCKAPFVRESRVKYALSLREVIPIELNGTFLVIGELINVRLPEDILGQDGFLQLDKAGSLCSNGLDAYYSVVAQGRFAYAKPNTPTEQID